MRVMVAVILMVMIGMSSILDKSIIDKSTFSLCQLDQIEWLGIESK